MWREARKTMSPVDAWASIVEDPAKTREYKTRRGMGGFARVHWDKAQEIIDASNLYTVQQYGPDRVLGFSSVPASELISFSPSSRYRALLGCAGMPSYDWYGDLPHV